MKTDVPFESFFAKTDLGGYGWSLPREYPARTQIIKQGEPARAVYFIEHGLVKLSSIDPSGYEVIAGLRRSHWFIGAPAVLLGKINSFTATSLIDCKIRDISAKNFLSLIEANCEFSRQVLKMFSQVIFNYGKAFCNLGCLSAIDRLKRLLYEIMIEIQEPLTLKDKVKLTFPLKNKELAQMIAVSPEYLSRLLKQLERDGLITREKEMIVLNNCQSLTKECEIH
ncbi:MAG: Crp/Fnr family transcriptional regulator [Dissulfurispiraceae bacterium]